MARSEEEKEDGDGEPEKVEGGKRGRGKRTFPSATGSCIGNTHRGLGVGGVFESKRERMRKKSKIERTEREKEICRKRLLSSQWKKT